MTKTLQTALDNVNNLTFEQLDEIVKTEDFSFSDEALEYMAQECEDGGPWQDAILSMASIWQEGYCIKNDIEEPSDVNSDIFPVHFIELLDIFSQYCQQVISKCIH